jgi:hypothetical protein
MERPTIKEKQQHSEHPIRNIDGWETVMGYR